jgi:hypothetical protein
MMSSAWSQGTSFRRRVTLPVTVSLVTTLKFVKSAITCSRRPDLDVLEVERELLAGVAGALHQLVRVDLLRADLEHELVVALVGAVLPGAARLDQHPHPIARLRGGDRLHRRAESR